MESLASFPGSSGGEGGKPYPPNTLYAICRGLMRYVREQHPTINFFADPEFASFREMKRLRSLGLGVKKKQAEPITVDHETLLWDKGQLGDHSPQTLLDTMICHGFLHS